MSKEFEPMSWSNRTRWGVAGIVALTVGTALAASAVAIRQAPAEPESPSTNRRGLPVDRNCWDRSQWGGGRTQPDCQDPDDAKPAPPPAPGEPDEAPPDGPVLVSHDLSSNRGQSLPIGTLQVVTFYDGATSRRPTLRIEYAGAQDGAGWIDITGIHASTSNDGRLDTFEYDLGDAAPTGRFEIAGIVPNGVIDGLAFGLFWRDAEGFHALRSTAPDPLPYASFVGAWPIALSDKWFALRTPQLTTGHARQQAKMAIFGAEYLDNGAYLITIQERAVKLDRSASAE